MSATVYCAHCCTRKSTLERHLKTPQRLQRILTNLVMRHAALVLELLVMSIGNIVIEMDSALREAISEVNQDSCVQDRGKIPQQAAVHVCIDFWPKPGGLRWLVGV